MTDSLTSNLRSTGMDTPWPLHDVLARLIEATEHLLHYHSCDMHGHEEWGAAVASGKTLLQAIHAAGSPSETEACQWCEAPTHGAGRCVWQLAGITLCTSHDSRHDSIEEQEGTKRTVTCKRCGASAWWQPAEKATGDQT